MIKVLQVVKALEKNGVTSVILTYSHNVDKEKFQMDIVTGTLYEKQYRDQLEADGCNFYVIPNRDKNPVNYILKLSQLIKKEHYSIVHSKVADVKGLKKLIFTKTEQLVAKKLDSAILVSAQLQPLFSVPSVVVRGVVNEEFYQESCNYIKEKNEKFTILYSGDLGKTRGVGILYNALNYFKKDCKVVITGKGQLESNDPRIDFKGFVSYQEVKNLMNQADVLLQCQRIKDSFAQVSFPSKIFEYIATGNIIVSSAMQDVKKIAGDAIIYYEDDDARKLSEALEKAYLLYKEEIHNKKIEQLCRENLPCNVGKRIVEIL